MSVREFEEALRYFNQSLQLSYLKKADLEKLPYAQISRALSLNGEISSMPALRLKP